MPRRADKTSTGRRPAAGRKNSRRQLFKEKHKTQRQQDKQAEHADATHLLDQRIQTKHHPVRGTAAEAL
jgi:hypothetical protein